LAFVTNIVFEPVVLVFISTFFIIALDPFLTNIAELVP
jgi:hypothetical protein